MRTSKPTTKNSEFQRDTKQPTQVPKRKPLLVQNLRLGTKISFRSMPSESEDMADRNTKAHETQSETHRYSISRLLHIGCRTQARMNLTSFSVEAIQAGIVTGPAMTPKQLILPLREVSNSRERGWSAESFDSQPDQGEIVATNIVPTRQPRTAPPDIDDQAKDGFARFLKEHSSPTHQRVTAGGRIVPMDPKVGPPEFKLTAPEKNGNVKKDQGETKYQPDTGKIAIDAGSVPVSNRTAIAKSSYNTAARLGNAPLGNVPVGNVPVGNAPVGNAPAGSALAGNALAGNVLVGHPYTVPFFHPGNNSAYRMMTNDQNRRIKNNGNQPADLSTLRAENPPKGRIPATHVDKTQPMSAAITSVAGVHDLPANSYFGPRGWSDFVLSSANRPSSTVMQAPSTFSSIAEEIPAQTRDETAHAVLMQRLNSITSHISPSLQNALPVKPVKSTSAQLPRTDIHLPRKPVFDAVSTGTPGVNQHGYPSTAVPFDMRLMQQGLLSPPNPKFAHGMYEENASVLEALEQTVTEELVKSAQKAFDDLGHQLRGQDSYTAQFIFDAQLTEHYGRERAKIVEERDLARRALICIRDALDRKKQKEKARDMAYKASVQNQHPHRPTGPAATEMPASTNLNVRAAAWVPTEKIVCEGPNGINTVDDAARSPRVQNAGTFPDFPMNADFDFSAGNPVDDRISHVCPGVRIVKENGGEEIQLAAPYQPGPYTRRYLIGDPLQPSEVDDWGIRTDPAPPHVARMQQAQAHFLEELVLQQHSGGSLDQAIFNIRQKMQQPTGPASMMRIPNPVNLQVPYQATQIPSIKLNGNELTPSVIAPAGPQTPTKKSRRSGAQQGNGAKKIGVGGVDPDLEQKKAGEAVAKTKDMAELKRYMIAKAERTKTRGSTPIKFGIGGNQLNTKTSSSVSMQNINAGGMVPGSQMVSSFDGGADRSRAIGAISSVAKALQPFAESSTSAVNKSGAPKTEDGVLHV